MEPQAGPDDTHLARTENRQLKETIGALRDQLESIQFEKEQGILQAIATANDEITQLKAMVAAMRGELERSKLTYEGTTRERERAVPQPRGRSGHRQGKDRIGRHL